MTRRRTLPVLLTIALLLGQAAAYAHALSHLSADSLAKEGLAHASLCAKCASFDKLTLIEPTLPPPDLRAEASNTPVDVAVASSRRQTTTPFQSRAPPHSL
jgi:hypothetical protein